MIDLYRLVARFLTADLHPSLGKPGGPCQVVKRIKQEVHNPHAQEQMIDEVLSGESLSNPEAAKIYDVDREMGNKVIKRIEIGPHAQYRMDLRSITIDDVQESLRLFAKRVLTDHKLAEQMGSGREIEWLSPSSRLFMVFTMHNGGIAKIITTYWQGRPDPAPPTDCPV